MTIPDPARAVRLGSVLLQLLGLAMILGGVAVIFAAEFEMLLPRNAIIEGLGGGLIGLGIWVNLRGRPSRP